MKKVLLCLVLFCSVAFAATPRRFDLNMNLKLNGKPLPPFRLVVKEGEKATIVQKTDNNRNFIDIVTIKSAEGIVMKFTIGTIKENSKRVITSTPTIITKENVEALITQGDSKTGREELSLRVVARGL